MPPSLEAAICNGCAKYYCTLQLASVLGHSSFFLITLYITAERSSGIPKAVLELQGAFKLIMAQGEQHTLEKPTTAGFGSGFLKFARALQNDSTAAGRLAQKVKVGSPAGQYPNLAKARSARIVKAARAEAAKGTVMIDTGKGIKISAGVWRLEGPEHMREV